MALTSCSDPQHCCPAVTSADPVRLYLPEEVGACVYRGSLRWEDLRRAMAGREPKVAGGKPRPGRRDGPLRSATVAAASINPPAPDLAHFVPASDQITPPLRSI